jgi:hypothetical protein
MKQIKKSKTVLITALIFTLGITLVPAGQIEVQAKTASKKTVAAAYTKLLTSSSTLDEVPCTNSLSDLQFAVFDINNDGIEELYVTGDEGYHANIYAYVNNKVKLIDSAFSGDYFYYKNANLVLNSTFHSGVFTTDYKKFTGKKMTTLSEKNGIDFYDGEVHSEIKYTYKIKGKTTTKAKYAAYVKKLKSNAKKAKLKLRDNTKNNRSKYL